MIRRDWGDLVKGWQRQQRVKAKAAMLPTRTSGTRKLGCRMAAAAPARRLAEELTKVRRCHLAAQPIDATATAQSPRWTRLLTVYRL